jgi:riboflavin kinase/FMN adenylyltransferase
MDMLHLISGIVQRHRQLGRTLGFPAANVCPPTRTRTRDGFYAIRAQLDDGRSSQGVASLGCNPSVGGTERLLEAWLFEFVKDILGHVARHAQTGKTVLAQLATAA